MMNDGSFRPVMGIAGTTPKPNDTRDCGENSSAKELLADAVKR